MSRCFESWNSETSLQIKKQNLPSGIYFLNLYKSGVEEVLGSYKLVVEQIIILVGDNTNNERVITPTMSGAASIRSRYCEEFQARQRLKRRACLSLVGQSVEFCSCFSPSESLVKDSDEFILVGDNTNNEQMF